MKEFKRDYDLFHENNKSIDAITGDLKIDILIDANIHLSKDAFIKEYQEQIKELSKEELSLLLCGLCECYNSMGLTQFADQLYIIFNN